MAEPMDHGSGPPASSVAKPKIQVPAHYVCPWTPFSWVTILCSVLLLGGGELLARRGGMSGVIAYILICTTIGLMLTLAATAWGALISLTESPRCGILFIVLPPYMFYYAATRWRWMSQPSILFLCGLGLMVWSILTGRQLLKEFSGN